MKIAGVRFKENWKVYDFDATDVDVSVGDHVIVDSERGPGFARVVRLKQVNGAAPIPAEMPKQEPSGEAPDREKSETALNGIQGGPKVLRKVARKATEEDIRKEQKNREREIEAFTACQELIVERELPMKLIRVEYSFDATRAIFFFFSESRVDFRELVKDLAHKFKIRIEMRQIGVRDVARLIGGYGPCGRDLCCASFLRNFEPVSIRMAKKQEMVLNPAKISGVCGRLLCCLSYEYEFYDEIKKDVAGMREREKDEQERRLADERKEAEARRLAEEKKQDQERKQNQERREKQKEPAPKGSAKPEKKKEHPPFKKQHGAPPQPQQQEKQLKAEQQPAQQKPAPAVKDEKSGQPKGRRRFWRRKRKKSNNSNKNINNNDSNNPKT